MDNQRLAQLKTPQGRRQLLAGGTALVLLAGGGLYAVLHRSHPAAEPRAAQAQKRGAGAAAARGPAAETVADEKLHLAAGQFKAYPLHLSAQKNVSVRVDAAPRPVNVALVQKARYERFRADHGVLFADKSQLVEALSGQRVVKGSPHARVPAGDWVLVVERPKDDGDSKGESGVALRVTTASVGGQ